MVLSAFVTDHNAGPGVKIDATGRQRILMANFDVRRDGADNASGGIEIIGTEVSPSRPSA